MRASFAAVAIAVVATLVSPAVAQISTSIPTGTSPAPNLPPAPFAPAPPGSVFQFKKYKVIVGTSTDYFVQFTANGKPVSGTLFSLGDPDYVNASERARFSQIWPLTVGKTVRYHRYDPRNRSLSWEDEVTVVGTDTLKIGEKSIDVYVLRWNSHGENRNNWEGTRTNWYAPSLGWNIKFTSSDNQGAGDADQVVDYQLAK
jgi:hypothetical protein